MKQSFHKLSLTALTVLLPAILSALLPTLLTSCSSSDPVWTIHFTLQDPDSIQEFSYTLGWNPVSHRLVSVETDTGSAQGIPEMRRIGYNTRPQGFFLLEETKVFYQQGPAKSQFLFQPDPQAEDGLRGSVTTSMTFDGETHPPAHGRYRIDPGPITNPLQYLEENSPAYREAAP